MKKLVIFLFCLFFPFSVNAAITHVQQVITPTANCFGFNVSSYAITISAVGNGNTVAGVVAWSDSGATNAVTSVIDDKSNVYNVVDTINDGSGTFAASFYLTNITNAPTVITVTFNNVNSQFDEIGIDEFSGVATVAIDGHSAQAQLGPGTGTDAVSSGSFTTATNGDLIHSSSIDYSNTSTISAGTGYTQTNLDTGGANACVISQEYKVQGTAGAVAGTFTTNQGAHNYLTFGIGLKAAGGAAPFVSTLPMMGVGK